MRRIAHGSFDVAPSALGFGCASLGSRIGGEAGLRALEAAYDRGVAWYDVAPAYGAAEAESLLGRFLAGKRGSVLVTTKVGVEPPRRLGVMKYAYAVGRPFLAQAGAARRLFRSAGATRNQRTPLTAELIESSIAHSLRRLRVDHVDVYALHDPDPEDVMREDVVRAMERVLARGQARRVAVAGRYAACLAASGADAPYAVLQMRADEFASHAADIARSGCFIVSHSVFGVGGEVDRLAAILRSDRTRIATLVAQGYPRAPRRAAAALLLDAALAANAGGVVLASMFDAGRRAENIGQAARPPRAAAPALLAEMLAAADGRTRSVQDAPSCA